MVFVPSIFLTLRYILDRTPPARMPVTTRWESRKKPLFAHHSMTDPIWRWDLYPHEFRWFVWENWSVNNPMGIYLVAIQIRSWTMIFYSQKWFRMFSPLQNPQVKKIGEKKTRISPALIREITFSEPLPKGFTWVPSVSPKRSRLPAKIAPGPWGTQANPSFFGGVIWPIVFEGWKKTLHFPVLGSKGTGNIRMFFFVGFAGWSTFSVKGVTQ